MNFFRPAIKLVEKQRSGAKIKKIYDEPKTPYQRLLKSKQISGIKKLELTQFYNTLNPFQLQKQMEDKIKKLLNKTTPIILELSMKNSN
jgi:hypothetical protein